MHTRMAAVLAVAGMLTACGGGAASAGSHAVSATRVAAVAASCAAVSPAAQFAHARLVFVGRMLAGRTVLMGRQRVLASPARMRVGRYLKGHGPRLVRVTTGVKLIPGGITGTGEGILPVAGERWRIYTNSGRQPFATSVCAGSRRIARAPRD